MSLKTRSSSDMNCSMRSDELSSLSADADRVMAADADGGGRPAEAAPVSSGLVVSMMQ